MSDEPVCEIPKNARETIRFRLGEFKGHKFVDMRVFIQEGDKDPVPTPKGLTVSPTMWAKFKAALDRVETAMIQEGWLDKEDLTQE